MPASLTTRLNLLLLIVWWASISVLGFWVVPMLFASLPTPAQAGQLAARLFAQQGWVALACGVALLLLNRRRAARRDGVAADRAALATTVGVLIALFAVIVIQYGVSPRIVARENLKFWHALGTGLYLLQWLAVSGVLWRGLGAQGPSPAQARPADQSPRG